MQIMERVFTPTGDPRKGSITVQYDIEKASWIWADGQLPQRDDILIFKNEFILDSETEFMIHVSGDHRFELSLNGTLFATGPDRSDVNHWSFSSYRIRLGKGTYVLSAMCWHLEGGNIPAAQTSFRGGFILGASENMQTELNTGTSGNWLVSRVIGVSFGMFKEGLICTAPSISGKLFFRENEFVIPTEIYHPLKTSIGGAPRPGWKLHPSPLPDQISVMHTRSIGKVAAILDTVQETDRTITAEDMNLPETRNWQDFIDGKTEFMKFESDRNFAVIIDLGDYNSGYSMIDLDGGSADSCIRMSWAESLFNPNDDTKGDRNAVLGKRFHKWHDSDAFHDFDGSRRTFRSFWWRSGRYVMLTVKTGSAPVKIYSVGFRETRYPLELEKDIVFSDNSMNSLKKMLVRGMQMCSHETFMDCPYYEQLMYVGDTRLEALTFYTMTSDHRLPLRAVELFEWSRHNWEGVVAEHYPSRIPQLSSTFSMIWPMMVKDFMYYRRFTPQWLSSMRCAVRSVINTLLLYRGKDGLIENLPGWSFVDWTEEWQPHGIPYPNDSTGLNSIFNLHFLAALKTAADIEDIMPEKQNMRKYFMSLHSELSEALLEKFWVPEKNMISDDPEHKIFSMHAQCLGLLYDVVPQNRADACYKAMLKEENIIRPTIYFSFYLFELFKHFGEAHKILSYLNIWTDMKENGAVTPWERPEPSRSDCHAWSSHLLYHYYSSLAGIRPAAPQFDEVIIEPQLGAIKAVKGAMPHPSGDFIAFDFKNSGDSFSAHINLPHNINGTFKHKEKHFFLVPGENKILIRKED